MTERKLTISALYRPGWHAFPHREQLPHLQLAGPWMEAAGFYPGARVRVDVVADGRLVVTRVDEGQDDAPRPRVVWDVDASRDVKKRSRRLEVLSA